MGQPPHGLASHFVMTFSEKDMPFTATTDELPLATSLVLPDAEGGASDSDRSLMSMVINSLSPLTSWTILCIDFVVLLLGSRESVSLRYESL